MNGREYMRLGLRILDEQIVDSTGRRCGRVEDLELDGEPGSPARVVAMLCGATAWKRRLPPRLAELFPDDPAGLRRVSWRDIDEIENEILLKLPEGELQHAAEADGGPLAVSQLMRARVVSADGDGLGRVSDVLASRAAGTNELWEIEGLLIGRAGAMQRIGFSPSLNDDIKAGTTPANLLPWTRIERFDDEGRLVFAAAAWSSDRRRTGTPQA